MRNTQVKVVQLCLTLCNPMDYIYCFSWKALVQNAGVGSLSLLQGIFPTQGSNPSRPYRRRILYQLSHKGSPRILEWVVYPFSSRSSQPRNPTAVSCIAGGVFSNWAIREALWGTHKHLHYLVLQTTDGYTSNVIPILQMKKLRLWDDSDVAVTEGWKRYLWSSCVTEKEENAWYILGQSYILLRE